MDTFNVLNLRCQRSLHSHSMSKSCWRSAVSSVQVIFLKKFALSAYINTHRTQSVTYSFNHSLTFPDTPTFSFNRSCWWVTLSKAFIRSKKKRNLTLYWSHWTQRHCGRKAVVAELRSDSYETQTETAITNDQGSHNTYRKLCIPVTWK